MNDSPITASWIAADWGTSNLRVMAMGPDGGVLAQAGSADGMGSLAPDGFEPALLRLVAPWLGPGVTPVLAAGMVGARQGWTEAAYRAVPCPPLAPGQLTRAPTRDPRLAVWIAPGLSQARPADVMRGEETQIAGALALRPGFDGVICLPGTHSKWAHLSAGEVVSFQTFLTGELYALLAGQSVLRHSLTGDEPDDMAAFDEALSEALSRPERGAARLFSIRAESLLAGLPAAAARGRLSGLLIGMELAGARPYWLGQPVLLVGSPALCDRYARALAAQGLQADTLSAADCTRAGLTTLLPGTLA
ncbi:MAG: 2-dehydro-3-deoxygalactonokinase [Paracoccaceae bacterium]